MLQLLKCQLTFNKITKKEFTQKQNLKRFRKEVYTFHNKDLTKSWEINQKIKMNLEKIESTQPVEKFSNTLKIRHKSDLKFNPTLGMPKNKRAFNEYLRKKAMKVLTGSYEHNKHVLENRLFK